MSVGERDFSNFELGDNVYELADGLIPEIAQRLDVDLADEPNSDELYGLVGQLGKNKVLRDNEEVTAIDSQAAADLLELSGVQKPLKRSLWTPNLELSDLGPGGASTGFTLITGGVANWQDRTAKLVADAVSEGELPREVRVVTGQRVMESKTDVENPNVKKFQESKLRLPTETEYATEFVLPVLEAAGARGVVSFYDTEDGNEIADNFARNTRTSEDEDKAYERLFETGKPVTFARVANAGVQLAVQFRQAIRANVDPEFDSGAGVPDVFILTDSFPIARTEEEKADPVNFQNPYTGLRQAVLTAKLLHEAANS